MIKINLLPYREKEKKESLQQQVFVFGGVLILFVLVILVVHFYFVMNVSGLESKIKQAELRLAFLDKKVGDIEGFKKDKKELEQKLGVINSLETDRLFPVRMLDELNMLVAPKEVWLEKITQTKRELRIEGTAKDNGAVARLMKKLEGAEFIKSVELSMSKQRELAGLKLQQFILNCVIKKGT
jgi:type IV pilus assembly protein PilN